MIMACKKIPAGLMVIPMLLSAVLNTFFPNLFQIGSFTTALFTSTGSTTIVAIVLFCMGSQLEIRAIPKVVKRGGLLLVSKFLVGAVIGIAVGKVFGPSGVCGLSALAIISAVTNSNTSIYLSLIQEYGDEMDVAAHPILTLNDGPVFTLIALGASGLAQFSPSSLIAAIIPIVVGMVLGNLDKDFREFVAPIGSIMLPFMGFTLGAAINIKNIFYGGVQGIVLGVLTLFVGGAFMVFCERFIGKRPGYAACALATTAGNAVAVPAAVALVDPAWEPYVAAATTQVAASVVFTAILVPFIAAWWAKKFGCPKYPLEGQDFSKENVLK